MNYWEDWGGYEIMPMKSLTEVTQAIAQMALSGTAPYDPFTLLMDAHHYLVEYYLENTEKNPPLAWCELLQMQGKPVYVVMSENDDGIWVIVESFMTLSSGRRMVHLSEMLIDADSYGTKWKAYRKERE